MSRKKIKIAIVGVGNCASSLVQGLDFYRDTPDACGVIHKDIGGYETRDIQVAAAFDVDFRKIGQPLTWAIFKKPNCTLEFHKNFSEDFNDPIVRPAPIMDGVSNHMYAHDCDHSFRDFRWAYNEGFINEDELGNFEEQISKERIKAHLVELGVTAVVNYLPVGSQKATEFWAEICLETGISFVNCIPVFIGSNKEWAQKFIDARIPMIGDDMRSCVGASIISAVLQELFLARGADVTMHYQDNVGGNTDFLNMQDQGRLKSKKKSKENVIVNQSKIAHAEVKPHTIKAGPAAYFTALKDNKRAHFLIKATSWGGAPIEFTADLSVEDSPNSAAVVCDAIRLVQVAREIGLVGPLIGPSAWTQKTPPIDLPTQMAREECDLLSCRIAPEFYEYIPGTEYRAANLNALKDCGISNYD
jgi:myo-inositol-1-phosphate synthase